MVVLIYKKDLYEEVSVFNNAGCCAVFMLKAAGYRFK